MAPTSPTISSVPRGAATSNAPAPAEVKITEVDPTDRLEVDDGSDLFAKAVALSGVTSLPVGASAVFVDGAAKVAGFKTAWFGSNVPSGFLIGSYEGSPTGQDRRNAPSWIRTSGLSLRRGDLSSWESTLKGGLRSREPSAICH